MNPMKNRDKLDFISIFVAATLTGRISRVSRLGLERPSLSAQDSSRSRTRNCVNDLEQLLVLDSRIWDYPNKSGSSLLIIAFYRVKRETKKGYRNTDSLGSGLVSVSDSIQIPKPVSVPESRIILM